MPKILLNGSERDFARELTLRQLLDELHLAKRPVAIEHNLTVVSPDALDSTIIKEGDRVEVVQFVGGGAPEAEAAPSEEKPKPKAKKSRKAKAGPASGATKLVIVESPAKAKTINKFLGKDYIVEASLGHVRDLPRSKMGVDVENNFQPQYLVMMRARQRVKGLKKLAQGKAGIFLAPDPDREGEAISWHLAHLLSEKNEGVPIYRVEFNEITKEAVTEAFKHPREIAMNLVNSQQARRILDRVVGYELSPLLWAKIGRGLSAGRVQSVALRLIVEREREIRGFVPQEYWTLQARLSSQNPENQSKRFLARLDKIGKEKAELVTAEQTEKIKQAVQQLPFRVTKIEKKERFRRPQAPFTTSKIQQEAYNRLGFPAAKTMRVAQKLYEGVDLPGEGTIGLITYMRTDSVNLADSARLEVVGYIKQHFGDSYLPEKPPVYKSKKGAQEAHEAIRPTSVHRNPESIRASLDEDEFKLYDLIWKKAIASQMSPAVDEHVSVTIVAGEEYFFKTGGRRNIFPGFSALYGEVKSAETKKEDEDDDEDTDEFENIPSLTEGETLSLHELLGDQHFTKPPGRFNDASLVKTLEELGIGRPSTYAPTIYTLLARGYTVRKSGAILPTELGETVVELLVEHFPTILNVQFTALMEEELDKIEDGEMEWVQVLKDFYGPFKASLDVAKTLIKRVKPVDKPTDYKCEKCQKPMVIKWGRFGEFMACTGFPECRNTKSLPTGVKCPEANCGGDLVKRMSKKRKTFYGCSNYPTCNHISNFLPKKDEAASPMGTEEKPSPDETAEQGL